MSAGDQPYLRLGAPLEVTWRTDGKTVCVVVAGDVDIDNADHLSRVLAVALRRATWLLVVDVTDLGFFGAAGIRVLTELHSAATSRGCRIELRGLPRTVRRILEITGVLGLFELTEVPTMTLGQPRRLPSTGG